MTEATAATEIPGRPSRDWLTPQVFGTTLILATVIPFVAGGAQALTGKTVFFPLQATITLLATIHVPLTAYLLFDRGIRDMIRRRPVALILVPLLIFAGCFVIFLATLGLRQSGTATVLVYFQLFVLTWNLWHFGKQNIGVYSFFRISQTLPRMLPVEKRLLVFSAALGAVTALSLGAAGYVKQYAGNENFDGLFAVTKYVTLIGGVGQLILLGVAVALIVAQRARHSWQSGLLFLLCSNFFLPQYLIAGTAPSSFIFACNTLGHGVQYCSFLGFHAGNDCQERERIGSRFARYLMPAAFLLTALFLADFYYFQKVVSVDSVAHKLSVWLGATAGLDRALADSIVIGILLNHFWLDSYFWRFQDPQSRNWMLSRFSFLFGARPAAPAAP